LLAPICQAVGQSPSSGLFSLQQTLTGKPEEIGIKGASIRGGVELAANFIRCHKTPRTTENCEDFWFCHDSCARALKEGCFPAYHVPVYDRSEQNKIPFSFHLNAQDF
jgi:hypothetical protein